MLRVLKSTETGHKALELAASIMNEKAVSLGLEPKYHVGNCYFDFGQDWMWTTVIYDTDGRGFQALHPRAWEMIVEKNDFSVIDELIEEQAEIMDKAA